MIKFRTKWKPNDDLKWVRLSLWLPIMMLIHGQCLEAQSLFNMIKGPSIPDCVPCRTGDDYCSKPKPCIAGPVVTTCNDYCRKPQPCAYAIGQFTCDDYCGKPIPNACSGCYRPTNYFEPSYPRSGRSTTIYEGPYGNSYVLRDPLLQPLWADQPVTQAYLDYQPSPDPSTPDSGQVFEARSTLNRFDALKRIR